MSSSKDFTFGQHLILLEKKLDDHIAAIHNPHSTTKADVGLGLVENFDAETDVITYDPGHNHYATGNAVINYIEHSVHGYIKLLGNEEVSGEPYHFTYYYKPLDIDEETIKVGIKTITLDNEKTIKDYDMVVPAATEHLAGLMTADAWQKVYLFNLENGTGEGSVQMKQDPTSGSGTFDFTGKNPNATSWDESLTGLITYGATGQFATTLGGKNAAQGKRSIAEGSSTIAKGNYSHAEGTNSVALGVSSHAEGTATTALGANSHAEGSSTQATGADSHAEGINTIAAGEGSLALGYETVASGNYSISSGTCCLVEGQNSLTGGNNTKVYGTNSVGFGENVTIGTPANEGVVDSAAFGYESIVRKAYSITSGAYNDVKHEYAAAFGLGLTTVNDSQTAVGKFNNITDSDNELFTVGNGTSEDSRSTAFKVYTDGHAEVAAMGLTDWSVATKKYVDDQDAIEAAARESGDAAEATARQNADTAEATTRAATDLHLQDQIDTLGARGRYLSLWNATTGLPQSEPTTVRPYDYQAGDYYIVGTVGTGLTLYRPDGTQYTGAASTAVESGDLKVNDTYYFDGSGWLLQSTAQREISFSSLAGVPADNLALSTALNAKAGLATANTFTAAQNIRAVDGISIGNGTEATSIWSIKPSANTLTFTDSNNVSRFYIDTSSIRTMSINPAADAAYGLGNSSRRFTDLYLSGSANIGTYLYLTNGSYTRHLRLDQEQFVLTDNLSVSGNVRPVTDNAHTLGTSSNKWKDIYLSGGTYFGSHGHIWDDGASNVAYQSDALHRFKGSAIVPFTGSSADLGASSYKWKDLYLSGGASFQASNDTVEWKLYESSNGVFHISRSDTDLAYFSSSALCIPSGKSLKLGDTTLTEAQLQKAEAHSIITTAPTADAPNDGAVRIVYLSAEPATKYNGYIYMIASN